MNKPVNSPFIVLAAAMELPDASVAPDWVHLLPTAKGPIATFDGRGPFVVANAEAVIAASLTDPRGIPVDINHSTNLAAPEGREAPAQGWITAMEARDDGIWGKVDWTRAGRDLVADKAYRAISPVMILGPDARTVARISVASLVNKPNLRGLATLNQESLMNWAKIAKALGLAEDASEDAILAAITEIKSAKADGLPALQSALAEIGTALGVSTADAPAILAAAKAKATSQSAQPAELVALQAELTSVTTQLNTLTEGGKRERATAFVDAAIGAGKVGVKPSRDRFIAMHMENPANAEALIAGLPALGTGGQTITAPALAGSALVALNADQSKAAALLGVDQKDYLATLNAERTHEETV